jgi:hypothetical protein
LINELGTENGLEVKNGEAVKRFISDIENHYADYLRLRNKVKQLRDDESLCRNLLGAMGSLGPAISSYLGRKPTGNDIREVIKLIDEHPKATNLVDKSIAEGIKKPSQSAVQVDSPTSDQIDEEKLGIKKIRPEPSDMDSNPTNADLVAHETSLRNKRNRRRPHPPRMSKINRFRRN